MSIVSPAYAASSQFLSVASQRFGLESMEATAASKWGSQWRVNEAPTSPAPNAPPTPLTEWLLAVRRAVDELLPDMGPLSAI